jgi:chemotaxis protein methyltransferase CheR
MQFQQPQTISVKAIDKRVELSGPVVLEDDDFERLGKFIMSQYGIKMPPIKKVFLQSRLQKRLKELGIPNFATYIDHIFSSRGKIEELPNMIDAVCTNKTDFFREPVHFDFLLSQGLEDYKARKGKKNLAVWSAGCSTGEEPYTLAMLLKEYNKIDQYIDFRILATDVSKSVLQHAIVGIYSDEKVAMIPSYYRVKYMQKGKGAYEHKVRVVSDLRGKITFQQFNLLEKDYNDIGMFDIIFCRNVLIYFEREIQYKILRQFCRHLSPGGYLFLGHSESITGFNLPLVHVKPTIFMKTGQKLQMKHNDTFCIQFSFL